MKSDVESLLATALQLPAEARAALAAELIQSLDREDQPADAVEPIEGAPLVEDRVKAPRSAADLFREVGPWEGDSTEEMWERREEERHRGGNGEPPTL